MQRYKINMNYAHALRIIIVIAQKQTFFAPEKIMKKIVYQPLRDTWSGR